MICDTNASKISRPTKVIIFLVVLFLLNSYYYLNHELHREYPGRAATVSGFEGIVTIGGPVTSVGDNGFYILVKHGSNSMEVQVLSDIMAKKGDRIEVLGLLENGKLVPEKLIIYRKWSYYAVFVRSVLAILIAFYMFFSQWSFNFRDKRFRRREYA